jgi:hypothetical protein
VKRLSSFLGAAELQSDAIKVIAANNLKEGDEVGYGRNFGMSGGFLNLIF